MTCVILGAGRTGRGFIARLLNGQARIAFIDRDADLVERLNASGRYAVRYFDDSAARADEIADYEAVHVDDPRSAELLTACDAVFVSVRGENCAEAGAWLDARVSPETCVIACENAAKPAQLLRGALGARAASGAIFCTTIEDGPLDILSEDYPLLHVSRRGISSAVAALRGIALEPDFDALMARKIYTYNAASALIAYLGAAYGIENYADAARDPRVEPRLDAMYKAVNAAVCAHYGVEPGDQQAFAEHSKRKFQNAAITDSVARNASAPERKLGPDERIIGTARLVEAHGGDVEPLALTAAAALQYMGIQTRADAGEILTRVSGLNPDEPLYLRILDAFEAWAREPDDKSAQ